MLSYIVWAASPDIFTIPVINHPLRYYSLMFALGFIISQQIMIFIFKRENQPLAYIDKLTLYMVVATILGARLGHVLFYEPEMFVEDPIAIINPFNGGFTGLASHGGFFGIVTALYLYSRQVKGQSLFYIMDRIVIVTALVGAMIRFGNFMNSEIIGKPTGTDQGVVFARHAVDGLEANVPGLETVRADRVRAEGLATPVALTLSFSPQLRDEAVARQLLDHDVRRLLSSFRYITEHVRVPADQPLRYELRQEKGRFVAEVLAEGVARHPSQLYESAWCVVLFVGLFLWWHYRGDRLPEGQLFGIFMTLLFVFRFLVEFSKENQVAFEDNLPLNMGQWLSIPLVIIGLVSLWLSARKKSADKTVAR